MEKSRSSAGSRSRLLRRHVAWPADHGSWVFLAGPLLIGVFAGGRPGVPTIYLVVAALCGFLLRQPITALVKILAGRRPSHDLAAARFWTAVYAGLAALHVTGLVLRGFGQVLYLAAAGLPVFGWYLWLVSRRAERRQLTMEILACGALALGAPAAMWVGLGAYDTRGWLLWALVWAQSATSIVYAYLRLEQRGRDAGDPTERERRLGRAAMGCAAGVTSVVLALGLAGVVPLALTAAYAVQWAEVVRGRLRPATGLRPRAIGLGLLATSALFTLLFVLAWPSP